MTADGVRAILFDFDGVLVNSEPVRFRAGREALADVPFFPDAARLLRRLPPGLRLAIASRSRRPEVTAVLAHEEAAENAPHRAMGFRPA